MKSYSGFFFLSILLSGCIGWFRPPTEPLELKYPRDLNIVRRSEWGWKPIRYTDPAHEIRKITLHHGGVDFPADKDPVAYLKELQEWSRTEKDWVDIPYHFMIDPEGIIYEARPINYSGDTNTDYDPRGHALICLIGNYETAAVNEQQLESIIALMTYLVERFQLDLDDIKGHKDYTETLCPGKNLYRYIENGTIRQQIEARLARTQ